MNAAAWWIAAAVLCSSADGPPNDASPHGRAALAALGEAEIVALEVTPQRIELVGPAAACQLLVTAVLATGERVDATRAADVTASESLVAVDSRRLIRPLAEGRGEVICSLGGHTVRLPLETARLDHPPPASFVREVMPALSRMGCNAGLCHGAAAGKNGLKLSLRGYDAAADHRALTDDLGGRRFNRAVPEQSLMLLKAAGEVPHGGGVPAPLGSPHYELLRRWIAEGVVLDEDAPRVTGIAVHPAEVLSALPGGEQQLVVTATYADGATRDVTADAFFESGDPDVLSADPRGLVRTLRRGEAAVLIRYEGAYAVAQFTVIGDREGFQWEAPPTDHFIDELVYEKLRRLKIAPSPLAGDAEFLRRVYLDLTGLPPTADQVRQFLADPRPAQEKRDEVIDRLLGSDAYVEHWTNRWADLLQVHRDATSPQVAAAMRAWIRQAIADNMPYDRFARAWLTESGSTLEHPPAAYFQVLRTPEQLVENSTQLFLGIRFNCNKCHDHPFERWTQRQYYELAAYFAQVERRPAPDAKESPRLHRNSPGEKTYEVETIADTATGDLLHPETGQIVAPALPFEHAGGAAGATRRAQFAAWCTAPENPYFAMSYVNRVWGYLLGVGLIEPVDDLRASNPPTNPELLDRLTREFIDRGFDTRWLIRTIATSRTYQHTLAANRWNEDDAANYARALPRRLPAETLFDAIHIATGAPSRLRGMPAGARAAAALDPTVGTEDGFLDLFGRPARESPCECERSDRVSLAQTLALINGPTVAAAVRDPQGAVARLAASAMDDRALVEELFLRILNRPPTEEEVAAAIEAFQAFDEDEALAAAALEEHTRSLDERQAAWEAQYAGATVWTVVAPVEVSAIGGTTLRAIEGGVIVAEGDAPADDKYAVVFETETGPITGLRIEALADADLPAKGPGRADNGNFVLSELEAFVAPADEPRSRTRVPLVRAEASFSQSGYEVAKAIDGDTNTGWAIAPQFGRAQVAVFETSLEGSPDDGARWTLFLGQYHGGRHTLGRFRIAVSTSPRPLALREALPPKVAAALAVPRTQRSEEEAAEIARHYRQLDAEYRRLSATAAEYARWRGHKRVIGAQDLAWALINSPAFLFR